MVTYHDVIHGGIEETGVLAAIDRTHEYQHQGRTYQLGLAMTVFPGAEHTRLSHTQGASHIAGRIASILKLPEEERLLARVLLKLHDIGHYDFSHALEDLMPVNHEEHGAQIILGKATMYRCPQGQIHGALHNAGVDPAYIANMLRGRGKAPQYLRDILSNPIIDADRLDYLARDSNRLAVNLGTIELDRLINHLVIAPTGGLGIQEKALVALEQFCAARYWMFKQVYTHPLTESGESMLRRAASDSFAVAKPLTYGDNELLARLRERGTHRTQDLVSRIDQGYTAFHKQVELPHKLPVPLEELEAYLTKMTRAPRHSVILNTRTPRKKPLPSFPVQLRNGRWGDFLTMSPLARTIFEEYGKQDNARLFVAPEYEAAARVALGIGK